MACLHIRYYVAVENNTTHQVRRFGAGLAELEGLPQCGAVLQRWSGGVLSSSLVGWFWSFVLVFWSSS